MLGQYEKSLKGILYGKSKSMKNLWATIWGEEGMGKVLDV